MLCQFLLYSKVHQLYLYIYISPLFWISFTYRSPQSRVPCATQEVLVNYLYYTWYQQCIYIGIYIQGFAYVNPNLQIHPTLLTPLLLLHLSSTSVSLFLFCRQYVYTNFLRLHIYQLTVFSFGLTSLCMTVSRSIHLCTNNPILFLFLAK